MGYLALATWRFGLKAAVRAGEILRGDGSALDAVEEAIKVVEEDRKVTSVGLGGIPNLEGICELDAAIMDGSSLRAGAVGGLRGFTHPISIARKVMEDTPHILLVGEEAGKFASKLGFRRVEVRWKEDSLEVWRRLKSKLKSDRLELKPYMEALKLCLERLKLHETISVLAVDRYGRIAAGSSTTGLPLKIPGRVGDSAVVGAGIYADSLTGGACATGVGEIAQITLISKRICDLIGLGLPPQKACEKAVRETFRFPYKGGIAVLAVDRYGRIGAASSREDFVYAYTSEDTGKPELREAVYLKPPG